MRDVMDGVAFLGASEEQLRSAGTGCELTRSLIEEGNDRRAGMVVRLSAINHSLTENGRGFPAFRDRE